MAMHLSRMLIHPTCDELCAESVLYLCVLANIQNILSFPTPLIRGETSARRASAPFHPDRLL